MDWKTASSYYETRLTDALNIQRHAVNLANLPQAEVPEKLKQILLQEAQPARRQLERLKKREFRIAVVGLEKAGKSTFVNAWLECDLLPAKGGRCTFTTTQIYSVENDINAFEEYLRFAIFNAASFESFCIQELKGLVDSFREKEGTWTGVALNEWLQGNPLLLAEIPNHLKSQESNLEVSERLRQLSIALKSNIMENRGRTI